MSRIAGRSRVKIPDNFTPVTELIVWKHRSVESIAQNAVAAKVSFLKNRDPDILKMYNVAVRNSICGVADRWRAACSMADQLVEDAIAHDSRLARRSKWVRSSDEGEIACPALLAMGDDAPFFRRQRASLTESNGGDPIDIVVSTDSKNTSTAKAAAFIAAVRLAQQFAPVNVWWQGSWLKQGDDNSGFVFLIPLVQNDGDFSRLDFVISDELRDALSFCIMVRQALDRKRIWNDCGMQSSRSYLSLVLDDASRTAEAHRTRYTRFVDHNLIEPDGKAVASAACQWLDWEALYWKSIRENDEQNGAIQALPDVPQTYTPPPMATPSDRRRWERESKEQQKQYEKEQKAQSATRIQTAS